jgi:cysteinyl-tRNA synthetase
MIAMIDKLIETGHAYPTEGDVYFDVSKDSDYGKLCGFDPEQLAAGGEVSNKKRNPSDFALWKGAKPGEPKEVTWASPWGPGRPGWHIECSVMSQKLLGDTLDIHGGGLDLRFPHHENELAQSESFTDKPFAKIWMHNGLLKLGTGKMAGSIGNVLNVADAFHKGVTGEVLRFFILNTQYRSPIDLGEWDPREEKAPAIPPGLENAKKGFETFIRFAERYERIVGKNFHSVVAPTAHDYRRKFTNPEFAEFMKRFCEHMDDDFNTGGAVGVTFELATVLNRLADTGFLEESAPKRNEELLLQFQDGAILLKEMGQILGLFLQKPESAKLGGNDKLVEGLMELLIDLRNNLRTSAKSITDKTSPIKKALFDQTDLIRTRLAELKVTLEDRPAGTTWRVE